MADIYLKRVIDDVIDECLSMIGAIFDLLQLRSTPKREFIDPSIAVALLGLTSESLLYDFHTFGFIFETLCIRDLKVYSSVLGGDVSYYRYRYDLELIVFFI